jgi:hypothetical protein
MKPTRPIITFKRWFRHCVTVEAKRENWDKVRLHLAELGLKRAEGERGLALDAFDYFETVTFNGDQTITFHFDDINHANFLIKKMKRQGHGVWYENSDGVRRNQSIPGNFTMADLLAIFGDPLPAKIQFLLKDLKNRSIDYFSDYGQMHQSWSKQKWWPEAFIYISTWRHHRLNPPVDIERECLRWLNVQGLLDLTRRHACGMYEFANANDAMMFKLTFGEDPLPK